jgi:hypothetical protein
MILGRGTIANIIDDRDDFVFFACGESNRFELTTERAERERMRILECERDKMFVYFSGLNIYYHESQRRGSYTEHKVQMENLVKQTFENYCIFRIGSVTWGNNPNTILNFIKKRIAETGDCDVQNVYRYFHTKKELKHWIANIPKTGKHEMNVTGKMVWIPSLVEKLKKKHK